MNRGRLLAHLGERLRVVPRDLRRVEAPEARPQLRRPRERRLQRHLLVEQHPDQQRERILENSLSASASPVM